MRASKASAIAALALLAVAPLPIATAISAAAAPVAPSTLGVDDLDDSLDDTVEQGTDMVEDVTGDVLPTNPDPAPSGPIDEPAPPPVKPKPEPEVVVPKPRPEPPTTTVPRPVPETKPIEDKVTGSTGSGSRSDSGSSGSSGAKKPATPGGASNIPPGGSGSGSGLGPTLLGDPLGAQFAASGANRSTIPYSGTTPLLPEANNGDPNIRSLLIAVGRPTDAISPVAEDSAGSITGLLVLGTLASLMLYGSAAYLKFGKRQPMAGKHKA